VAVPHESVEELEHRLDEILHRRVRRRAPRTLRLTEENVRRVFGMSMWELFLRLCKKFGYAIEEGT
jgi:hypothetical protein